MKKIKDTKLGSWLADKAPSVLNFAGDMLPDKGVLGIVKNLISNNTEIDPASKIEGLKLLQEFELEMTKLENADRDSAREMQKEALRQDDKFSKQFLYWLAAGSLLLGFTYVFLITFVDIPEANKRFADTILGVVIATIITTIYNFFFGSSKGSKDKDEKMK